MEEVYELCGLGATIKFCFSFLLYLPQHNLKKQAVPERNQVSDGRNSNSVVNTSCSSGRSTTKKRSPENSRTMSSVYSTSIKPSVNIGELNTRICAEGIGVGGCWSKDTSVGDVEVGCPLPSCPGAGLQEKPKELRGKGGVHSSSRRSHDNSPISSYLLTLGQLPAHFSTNGKSGNKNVMANVGVFLSWALVV